MTRDGLTVRNMATGESENISIHNAGEDASVSSDTVNHVGKAVDRISTADEHHAEHKAAKRFRKTVKEGSSSAHSSSRIQFTDEERMTPELAKAIKKSDKAADKLDKAKQKILNKKSPAAKSNLSPTGRIKDETGNIIHGKIREVEKDNSGVEAGHLGERGVEKTMRSTGRKVRGSYRQHRLKPWTDAKKATEEAATANATYRYKKVMADDPQLSSNVFSRMWQKHQIKKNYAKEFREAGKGAQKTVTATKSLVQKAKDAAEKLTTYIATHWKALLVIGPIALVITLLAGSVSSCSTMFSGSVNTVLGTSYTAEDADISGVEVDYAAKESDLQSQIDNIESTHSGYDEYRYDLEQIGHDPYELASYLTVTYEDYTREEVQAELNNIFALQYVLSLQETVETRYRTETRHDSWTDDEGHSHTDTYTVEVPYDYYILTVTLRNHSLGNVMTGGLSADQSERYQVLMETHGGRDNIFPDNPSLSGGINAGEYTDYDIPGDALTDATFAQLMNEAEKYLGYPYVWGGSSPSTSFDCSGFVCYVLNHSGVYSIGRTTAEGIRQQCAIIPASEAKPGDIIFFQGTYSTSGASHVGIYVGNGMMIHCGNPIQYSSIETNYWKQHFYCFGRLNYK